MERLQIVLCGKNRQELEDSAIVCREICEKCEVFAYFKFYSNCDELLFDMNDQEFLSTVSVFILDPVDGFSHVSSDIRKNGYDGIILYLSYSESLEYYRQAFDVGAFNFLEKGTDPQTISRFQSVFESLLQTIRKSEQQYLVLNYAGNIRRIEIKDIQYFESAPDHMINVVYNGGNFMFSSTMKSLEARLCNCHFVRIHRSYLVSVYAINRLEANELVLNNERRLTVSRDRYQYLKSVMRNGQL